MPFAHYDKYYNYSGLLIDIMFSSMRGDQGVKEKEKA